MEPFFRLIRSALGLWIGSLGLFSGLLAITCFAGLVGVDVDQDDNSFGTKIGFLFGTLFFGFLAYRGYKFAKDSFRSVTAAGGPPAQPELTPEQTILELALASDGTLTIAEIAACSNLSVSDAKTEIEALTKAGVASVEFNDEGDVYYRFAGLTPKGLGRSDS